MSDRNSDLGKLSESISNGISTAMNSIEKGLNSVAESLKKDTFNSGMLPVNSSFNMIYSLANPVFKSFALCGVYMGTKLLLNSSFNIFSSLWESNEYNDNQEKSQRINSEDLESFVPFFILGMFYVSTSPQFEEAEIIFRSFIGMHLLGSSLHEYTITKLGCWSLSAFMAFKILRTLL